MHWLCAYDQTPNKVMKIYSTTVDAKVSHCVKILFSYAYHSSSRTGMWFGMPQPLLLFPLSENVKLHNSLIFFLSLQKMPSASATPSSPLRDLQRAHAPPCLLSHFTLFFQVYLVVLGTAVRKLNHASRDFPKKNRQAHKKNFVLLLLLACVEVFPLPPRRANWGKDARIFFPFHPPSSVPPSLPHTHTPTHTHTHRVPNLMRVSLLHQRQQTDLKCTQAVSRRINI